MTKYKLGDLTKIRTGKLDANASSPEGVYPFFTCSKEPLKIDSYSYDCECVLVAGNGDLNVKYYNGKFDAYQRTYIIEDSSDGRLYIPYLYFFLDLYVEELRKQSIGGVIKYIKLGNLTDAVINLPSIEEQKSIVNNLEKSKSVVEYKTAQLDQYDQLIKSRFVEMFGDPIINQKGWKTDKLQNVCPVNKYKGVVEKINGKVWLLNLDMVESNTGKILDYVYEDEINIASSTIKFDTNCVLYSKLRPYLNKVVVPLKSGYATSEMISINTDAVNKHFLSNLLMMNSFVDFANGTSYGAKMPRASVDMIKNFDLMLPPKTLQEDFSLFILQVDKLKFEYLI
jgi:type I restriction enzyme S subunit